MDSCGEPKSKRTKTTCSKVILNSEHERNGTNKILFPECIKVGSRKSQLALFQSNFVVGLLRKIHPEIKYEIIPMSTTGDNILNIPLSKIGEKSLFTKELEVALEKKEVDFLVHSLKDLPTTLPSGMVIGAICRRESPFDAVVFPVKSQHKDLASLPKGSIVGTSSLRRVAQLKRSYPHLEFKSARGNLNTRLRKLDEEELYDALILATAGLERMDLSSRIACILPSDVCMYAVGQGALAIECKAEDESVLRLIADIADEETTLRCIAERSFMKKLEGGCSVPVAVCSTLTDNKLTLQGGVFSLDGSISILDSLSTKINGKIVKIDDADPKEKNFCGVIAPHLKQQHLAEAENLGIMLAETLLKRNAASVLEEARKQNAQP